MEFRFDREHGRSFHFHRMYLETLEGILELLETRGYRVLRIHDDVRGYESIEDIRSHPGEATRQFAVVAVAEDEARSDRRAWCTDDGASSAFSNAGKHG